MNNKIKIPWYRYMPKKLSTDLVTPTTPSFNFDFPKPEPVAPRVPVTDPVRVPVTSPVRAPSPSMVKQPDIGTNPYRIPDFGSLPVGLPFPVPTPFPDKQNEDDKTRTPTIPNPAFNANWLQDTINGWKENPLPTPVTSTPTPINSDERNVVDKTAATVLSLIIGAKVASDVVQVKVGDPIYAQMETTPIIGGVLQQAKAADVDMEVAATYFANYDWNNVDIQQMSKDLTAMFGAAAAARMIGYIAARLAIK